MCSNSQRKTHQITQICYFELQKWQYTTTEVDLRFIVSFNMDITQYLFTILRLFNIPLHFFIFQTYNQTRCLYGLPVVYPSEFILLLEAH